VEVDGSMRRGCGDRRHRRGVSELRDSKGDVSDESYDI